MSGVRCVVWDEWCEMTSVWHGWCETYGVRWRRWVVYDGGRWVVRAEWWEMSGGRWVVGDEWCMMAVDEWWGLSGERWVVGDECVCDVLYEMSEMSSVRCLCMWYVVVKDEWDEWCELVGEMNDKRWIKISGAKWVVWKRLLRMTFIHKKAPNSYIRKI